MSAIDNSFRTTVYPQMYGAVGDGIADDTAAWNAAIQSGAYLIDGLFRTYKITSALTGFSNNQCIQNAIFDFSSASGGGLLKVYGTIATGLNLTANTSINTAAVTVASTATLSAEALVFMSSIAVWSSDGTSIYGQYARVKTVDSSTQVTLYDKVLLSYNTADTAKIALVTPKKNVSIRRCKIIGAGSGTQIGVDAQYTESLNIVECEFYGIDNTSVGLWRCYKPIVSRCATRKATAAGTAYAYAVWGGCFGASIAESTGEDCRHTVTIGDNDGINLYTTVNGCHAIASKDAGFDSHNSSMFTVFNGNTVDMSGALFGSSNHDGIISQGAATTITNNIVRGPRGTGIFYQPYFQTTEAVASCIIANNYVQLDDTGASSSGYGIYVVVDPSKGPATTAYVTISGNQLEGGANNANGTVGIQVYSAKNGGTIKSVQVTNNILGTGINSSGMVFRAAAGGTIQDLLVSGGSVTTTGTRGVYFLTDAAGAVITNIILRDTVIDAASIGVQVTNTSATISRVTLANVTYRTASTKLATSGTIGDLWNMDAASAAPTTVTNSTVTIGENVDTYIFNRAGSITVTLPSASSYPRRTLRFSNITANTVVSGSSDVVPVSGGAAGTAILPATAGSWVTLFPNGSSWQILQS